MHGLFKEKILGSERRLCWLVMRIINTHIWKIRAKVATEQFKGAVSCFFSLFNRKNEFMNLHWLVCNYVFQQTDELS